MGALSVCNVKGWPSQLYEELQVALCRHVVELATSESQRTVLPLNTGGRVTLLRNRMSVIANIWIRDDVRFSAEFFLAPVNAGFYADLRTDERQQVAA